ncbi:MAG: hypothetical protein JNM09_19250 [Blastocatellia bacterium]|nr:hypothetical protein [Blastocatellia bacterium]
MSSGFCFQVSDFICRSFVPDKRKKNITEKAQAIFCSDFPGQMEGVNGGDRGALLYRRAALKKQ